MRKFTFDMRDPLSTYYNDILQVIVCRRSFIERVQAAAWLLFGHWNNAGLEEVEIVKKPRRTKRVAKK